ncbi:MAG: (d)CMP kinase [Clostridia bacterium]|nr:(d)CMP kinase [Clostridia bacterium]
MKKFSIAIDGPSGAGKSTISKTVAKKLGIVHIDTGAIYRTIGLYFYNLGIECNDAEKIVPLLDKINIELKITEDGQKMLLDGKDVSLDIRQHHISQCASQVSAIPQVREHLLNIQRDFAKKQSIVMDGRDIGTVVLPDADIKLFLTASPESRAQRRYEELCLRGENVSYEKILEDVKTRDYNDSHREIAPLKPADDSILVDTTGFELQDSIDKIIGIIEERIKCF